MVFGTHWEYRGNSTQYQWDVANVMQGWSPSLSLLDPCLNYPDLWLSFAADATQAPSAELPDGSTFAWSQYESGSATLAQFANDGAIAESVDASFIDDGCAAEES